MYHKKIGLKFQTDFLSQVGFIIAQMKIDIGLKEIFVKRLF